MLLAKLSDDLLLLILDHIEPADLCNFTSCCRLIYNLGKNHLRHYHELKSRYSKTSIAGAGGPPIWYKSPIDVLLEIQNEPLIGHYVQSLHFVTMFPKPERRIILLDPAKVARCDVETLLAGCHWLSGEEQVDWTYRIRQGRATAFALATLMNYLPNLTELRLVEGIAECQEALQTLTSAILSPTDLSADQATTRTLPLSKLCYLRIEGSMSDDEYRVDMEDIKDLIYLPALKKLCATSIMVRDRDFHANHTGSTAWESNRTSPLETVEFEFSYFTPNHLFDLFVPLENLRMLRYEHIDRTSRSSRSFFNNFVRIAGGLMTKRGLTVKVDNSNRGIGLKMLKIDTKST